MPAEVQIVDVDHSGKPRRYVFVLMENFTMLCFAAALESLRIANRTAGKELYTWKIVSESGEDATCSNGCAFRVDSDLPELERDDVIMLCSGIDVQHATTKRLLNWIRREARRGATVAGLCTAGYTMAKAGLLDGKRATIHWENQDSFAEEFEEEERIEVRSDPFGLASHAQDESRTQPPAAATVIRSVVTRDPSVTVRVISWASPSAS